jgi:hypothetical protein
LSSGAGTIIATGGPTDQGSPDSPSLPDAGGRGALDRTRALLAFRMVDLLLGLVYPPLGLVWVDWVALGGRPLGLLGLLLLRIAERSAPRTQCSPAAR